MRRRTFLNAGLAALGGLTLTGCNLLYGGPPPRARGYGPPPHAPAHGYRHKHHASGVDLVFDSGLGVYVVAGLGHYYYRDRFFRWHPDGWQLSRHPRGPWRWAYRDEVPGKLYKSKVKAKGRGRGHGRGRGGY